MSVNDLKWGPSIVCYIKLFLDCVCEMLVVNKRDVYRCNFVINLYIQTDNN